MNKRVQRPDEGTVLWWFEAAPEFFSIMGISILIQN